MRYLKHLSPLLALVVAATALPARAQTAREQAEARALYQQANTPAATNAYRAAAAGGHGFLGGEAFQPGSLRTLDGRNRPVPGLRYHVAQRLLEAQDSIELDSTHLWPMGSLRGFDLGEPGDPAKPLRRFRPRLVKEGSGGPRREWVEVLTAIDAGPLLLGWLYAPVPDAQLYSKYSTTGILMAGPGTVGAEPLRPLEPSQTSVLRLFGNRADAVRDFATQQRLNYTRPADIARMMDFYNRSAVVK